MHWLVSLFYLVCFYNKTQRLAIQKTAINHIEKNTNVLFVFSHPDDESMFFTPAIKSLRKTNSVFFLCLSLGYTLKEQRKRELLQSALSLSIPKQNVFWADSPELQDGPKQHWPSCNIITEIQKTIKTIGTVHYILTFDQKGVSSHLNHISVYAAVVLFSKQSQIVCLKLKSFSLL